MQRKFYLQLGFTLAVCAFMIVPVILSVLAGVTENFFTGLKSGLTLRWVGEVWGLYMRRPSISRSSSRSPASRWCW